MREPVVCYWHHNEFGRLDMIEKSYYDRKVEECEHALKAFKDMELRWLSELEKNAELKIEKMGNPPEILE